MVAGGSTLTITGNLMNSGKFGVVGAGDIASLRNGLNNDATGSVDVDHGSTLNITGDVTNDGTFATDIHNIGGGNTITESD